MAAVGFPAIATGLVFAINRTSGVTAVSLYLLAVVLAAAAAGVWGGLIAAALSFAGFIFFFTEPRFTFRVAAVEDVVAAVVLLLVALVVGFLVARVLDEHGSDRTARARRTRSSATSPPSCSQASSSRAFSTTSRRRCSIRSI